ncbi:uncharacterized protein LOC111603605 isoform X5 [Drosophila hydei]|uniref:Uncharacterized protein LOC111603605 isoform X5 n=1 Tax=Drosophila hydei TaxID=7224 RepID=A0A6J2SY31_DROHY|nr:uncharacterized protein LOC111603605 isoform X5 [Drosophila hydei]
MLNTLTLFWPFGDNWRLGVASTKHQRRQSVGSWMQISELALGKDLQRLKVHEIRSQCENEAYTPQAA